MRTLKKTLALVLVVAMMMSLCITSNAAYTDEDKINYETAVEVLSAIGVVEGYEDGSFKPTGNVTRAEAAAIIVRAIGADVNAVVEEATFSDVPTTHWASKYVEYCAAAGIIDGRGNGTFDPSAPVTGYELGKMLLKVLGYTGNYTGSAWQIAVALDAADAGLYAGNTKADKTKAATREETCLYTLNALVDGTYLTGYPLYKVTTTTDAEGNVESTARALNYYSTVSEAAHAAAALNQTNKDKTVEYTIGYSKVAYRENYMLKDVHGVIVWDSYADIWGRPGVNYYDLATNGRVIDIYDMVAPVAVYNVAVSDCDLAVDLGLSRNAAVLTYINGTEDYTDINVKSYALENGDQGRIIEVYENDRLVVIDTYLAQVTKVNDYKFDKNGHYITGGWSDIVVYDKAVGYSNCAIEDLSYPAGSWILVQHNNETETCYPVQVADTMVGAQSIIWYNAEKHTVAGETYMDAVNFYLDDAQHNAKQQYTWFFDQFGNLIGAVKVQDVYTYGIITEIQWINPVGSAGYAQATIMYVDGTTESLIIDTIDGKELKYTAWEGNLASGAVSANYAYNYASYVGHALYQVATASNGVATLNTITAKLTNVTMAKGDPSVEGTGGVAYVDDNTQYLVGSYGKTGWSWTTVTGYNQIANLKNATFFSVNLDRDLAAELVYVYGQPATSTTTSLVYIANQSYAVYAGDDNYITLKGAYVEGELVDVVVNKAWIDGEGRDLVPGTLYYMVDVNGNGVIDTRTNSDKDTVVEITTTPATVGVNTEAVVLETGTYTLLNNAIQILNSTVSYNTVNYALYGAETFSPENDIVVVYNTAYGYNYVVAVYVIK